ncbi:MAG: lysozyme inhibitor LprI family protein, partial [Clostridia bacterium]|nr:lysozyme inhibitor LprI family protein [Clostridia bacterium]
LAFVGCQKDYISEEKAEEFLTKAAEIEEYSEIKNKNTITQTDINIESYNIFLKWDELLNEIYTYLSDNMDKDDFASLEEAELLWIAEKEAAIEEAAKDWEGGSGEAMVRNVTASSYTKERCYYLISIVKGEKFPE